MQTQLRLIAVLSTVDFKGQIFAFKRPLDRRFNESKVVANSGEFSTVAICATFLMTTSRKTSGMPITDWTEEFL